MRLRTVSRKPVTGIYLNLSVPVLFEILLHFEGGHAA